MPHLQCGLCLLAPVAQPFIAISDPVLPVSATSTAPGYGKVYPVWPYSKTDQSTTSVHINIYRMIASWARKSKPGAWCHKRERFPPIMKPGSHRRRSILEPILGAWEPENLKPSGVPKPP